MTNKSHPLFIFNDTHQNPKHIRPFPLDRMCSNSYSYLRNEMREPDLQMPDEFWQGTGDTSSLKPKPNGVLI
ncbi:hypothetical protein Cflav_PD3112 [Pedosphaera parvula Ellin514]|uniref:Uncharacterized protein n=1 Tax=Pedosphaera parvula (strain Ellin514) TaxID=320771 RepID=B9XJJ2_PEDPL|nr:hypothetical protein Cflav_PD3112 [Pedosphaera parvula Ellin514]